MSVAYRSTCRPTIGQPLSVDISTDISVECQSTYRPMLDRYVGRYIERHISVDISTDTRPICQPIRWSTVGRYVNRYVARGVHKIHMIRGHASENSSHFRAIHTPLLCPLLSQTYPPDVSRLINKPGGRFFSFSTDRMQIRPTYCSHAHLSKYLP